MEGGLVIGKRACTCACMLVYYTLVMEEWRHGTSRAVNVQCTSKASFLPLHYPLRLVPLHHLCTHLGICSFFFFFGPSRRNQSEDKRRWQLCRSCPEMLLVSNKWYVRNHSQIESRLSKCQLGSGYVASLPVWFQQLADLFIATAEEMYCTGEFLIHDIASYLHRVITVAEVWNRFFWCKYAASNA